MAYNRKDYFFHQAKKENFAARSVFKLQEMDQRFRILRPGQQILDLGAAPGSWSQYCSQKVGKTGRVLGIDLQEIKLTLPNALFITADLRDLNLEEVIEKNGFIPPFDLVISDMAPRTTGIKIQDQARSMELCELALDIAKRFLKKGGHFVVKFFHSDDFEVLRKQLRENFEKVEILRPKSTRKESKEIFLIAMNRKQAPEGLGSKKVDSSGP